MKVTYNWLKQYVQFDWPPEQLAERLTMLGIEVEGIQKLTGEFEGIVVAQVISRDKHPNADKLSLCRVNDGMGERQIVCGAQNFKAGDKVPLILPGQTLPIREGVPPLTIKVGKIRGYESHGMLCSPQELGLPDPIDGLLILREDALVGQSFAEYLGRSGGDVVFDLEVTPNRPDLNSVIGIAREIAAVTGSKLKLPQISELATIVPPLEKTVAIRVEAPELCARYVARMIRGAKIGPSPDWLRACLEKVGMRSINNVVDVTNFVMLEIGEPLHAFDFRLLSSSSESEAPTIVVRTARSRETFETLDGQKKVLTSEMLLIADETKAIALAGVMGGKNSEISDSTTDILIESAYFKPQSIRATSKKLDLRTESAYRFERGCDIGICDWASRRAAQLIIETAGGKLAEGAIDTAAVPNPLKQISLSHSRTDDLLGVKISQDKQVEILKRLALLPMTKNQEGGAGSTTFQIPSFRVDLKEEIDLIEEIVRLHGINNIPSTPPRGGIGSNEHDSIHDQISEVRRLIIGLGLYEAQGQTLISDKATKFVPADVSVALANPLSSDMNILRPSLLPGLIDSLRHNISHRNTNVSLFEVGRVFLNSPAPAGGKPDNNNASTVREERRLAISMTGLRRAPFWSGEGRDARLDIHDLKGILEEFFEQFGARAIAFHRRPQPNPLFVESAEVHLGKFVIGEIGQLLPTIARQSDLRDPVFLAELNLDILIARRNPGRNFKALPNRPSVRRDVAMLLPERTTHEEVLQAVKQARPSHLESVELFDIFRGQNVPSGQKSVAYAFIYRAPETTLTDAEVNATHEKLVAHFRQTLNASIRDN